MSLILTIHACYTEDAENKDLVLTNDGQEARFDAGTTDDKTYYCVTLKSIEFHKKMYAPGEIIAELQISGTKNENSAIVPVAMSSTELNTYFLAKQVTLKEGSNTIAKGYYVHTTTPKREKGSDALFATLRIYSPDKLWTLDKYSRSYVGKRLYHDILLDDTVTDASKNLGMAKLFMLPYSSASDLSSVIAYNNLNSLGYTTESSGTKTYTDYVLPYLVQYNETFYDFLVRTANRWGEFLYFENGKLNYGYTKNKSAASPLTSYKTVAAYSTSQGSPLTIEVSSHNVANPSKKDERKQNEEKIVDEVTTDEYLTAIKNKDDYYDQVRGEITNWDGRYIWRRLGELFLKVSNIYGWILSFATDDLLSWGRAKKLSDDKNKTYKDNYFGSSNSFKNEIHSSNGLLKAQYKFGSSNTAPKDAVKLYQFASADSAETVDPEDSTAQKAAKGPTAVTYAEVLKYEIEAGKNLICIDLGPTYTHLLLGETFCLDGDSSTEYMVMEVHCVTEYASKTSYSLDKRTKKVAWKDKDNKDVEIEFVDKVELKTTTEPTCSQHYRVVAVKEASGGWYPPIHENGHVRTSGPQLAYIDDTDDPTRNLRYRVKYAWQTTDNDKASPWIPVANPMATKNGGAYFKLQKNDQVLLNYEAGNVERPYIVGAMQNLASVVPPEGRSGVHTLVTPGGQTIRLSDGSGGVSFLTSMNPCTKLITGFIPKEMSNAISKMQQWTEKEAGHISGGTRDRVKEANEWMNDVAKNYDGNIELTDKFGLYSIKASTTDRSVSIKSVFGDVKLNAFTGITISAPNGDVKIQGKNVTIEAGNNLKLTSGTNVHNGFLGDVHSTGKDYAMSLGRDTLLPLMKQVASYIDMTLLRCTWETLLKPIEGTLQIKSNRFVKLEAGKGSAGFPYAMLGNNQFDKRSKAFYSEFEKVNAIAVKLFKCYLERREACYEKYKALSRYFTAMNARKNGIDKDICNKPDVLLKKLWDKGTGATIVEADLGFDGRLGTQNLSNMLKAKNRKEVNYIIEVRKKISLNVKDLFEAIQAFKALIVGTGAAAKLLMPEEFDNYSQDIKDAIEHHANVSLLPWPAARADGKALEDFFKADSRASNADNVSGARKLAISIAIKLVETKKDGLALVSKKKANMPVPAPVDFSAGNPNFDQQWADYVNGITFNTGVNANDKNFFQKKMEDFAIDSVAFFDNTADSYVWGGDNNAGILMSSGDGTFLVNNVGQLEKLEAEYKTRTNYAMVGFELKSQYTIEKIKRALRGINGIDGTVQ